MGGGREHQHRGISTGVNCSCGVWCMQSEGVGCMGRCSGCGALIYYAAGCSPSPAKVEYGGGTLGMGKGSRTQEAHTSQLGLCMGYKQLEAWGNKG